MAVEAATVSERAAGMQAAVRNASGYVTARRRATVSSKITGKVVEVNVEEGMAVTEGQVLARLDDATLRAGLALAEAQAAAARSGVRENEVRLAEAKVTLVRRNQLLADKLVTQADVDAARAEVDSLDARISASREQVRVAERQIELERTNLDDTVIRAPFSGVRSPRMHSRAKWSRRCRPAAASPARGSARLSTCDRSRSKSTSTRATSTA